MQPEQPERTPPGRFFEPEQLARVTHLRFSTRHRIEGRYSGRHDSHSAGGAGEFVDYREYVEGEDLRQLDWRVLARTDRAYVRRARDETNLVCTMVVDASGSMRFAGYDRRRKTVSRKASHDQSHAREESGARVSRGSEEPLPYGRGSDDLHGSQSRGTRGGDAQHGSQSRGTESGSDKAGRGSDRHSKLEYVQYLATALCHIIVRQRDQVGLAVVSDGLRAVVPPAGTAAAERQIREAIEAIESEPATRLGDGLRELFRRVPRRGVLLVMSDFLDDDLESAFSAMRMFRHEQWEVVGLHVIHPDESRLPEGRVCRLEGLEGEAGLRCVPDDLRERYRLRFDDHLQRVRQSMLAMGADYHRVDVDVPYLQTLHHFLVSRTG